MAGGPGCSPGLLGAGGSRRVTRCGRTERAGPFSGAPAPHPAEMRVRGTPSAAVASRLDDLQGLPNPNGPVVLTEDELCANVAFPFGAGGLGHPCVPKSHRDVPKPFCAPRPIVFSVTVSQCHRPGLCVARPVTGTSGEGALSSAPRVPACHSVRAPHGLVRAPSPPRCVLAGRGGRGAGAAPAGGAAGERRGAPRRGRPEGPPELRDPDPRNK